MSNFGYADVKRRKRLSAELAEEAKRRGLYFTGGPWCDWLMNQAERIEELEQQAITPELLHQLAALPSNVDDVEVAPNFRNLPRRDIYELGFAAALLQVHNILRKRGPTR